MKCQQCVKENEWSISERGYGYGYIAYHGKCPRHDVDVNESESIAQRRLPSYRTTVITKQEPPSLLERMYSYFFD